MGGYTTNIEWSRTLEQDIADYRKQLNAKLGKVFAGNGEVANSMKDTLKRHIDKDVYEAYQPKVYPRRSDNPQFGTPLNDMDANSTTYAQQQTDGVTLTLDYHPTGENSATFGDLPVGTAERMGKSDTAKVKPNPVHGDTLIRRIETGKGYDWNFSKPRAFWQNFVSEMIEGGEIELATANALAALGEDATAVLGDVLREADDGTY